MEYRFANNVKPETGPAARNRSAPKTSRIDRNSTGSRPPNFRYGPRVHHRFPRLDEFQSSNERRGSKRTIVLFFSFLSFFLLLLREYINEKRAQTIFLETAAAPFLGKRRGEITAARILRRLRTGRREAFIICGLRSDPRYPRYRGPSLDKKPPPNNGGERLRSWTERRIERGREREGETLTLRSENEEENEAGISPWKVWRSGEGEGEEKTIRRKEKEEEEGKRR